MRFFTADLHLNHKNVHKYCPGRSAIGGSDLKKHDETLIANWNKVVSKDDDVYVLGDFAFCNRSELGRYVKRLNGNKHLILGNHDRELWRAYIYAGFLTVQRYLMIEIKPYGPVGLAHDPSNCIVDQTIPWLCGHLHHQFSMMNNCINVGVDVRNFTPMNEEEVRKSLLVTKKCHMHLDVNAEREFDAEFLIENLNDTKMKS